MSKTMTLEQIGDVLREPLLKHIKNFRPELCEWAPKFNEPAKIDAGMHLGCQNEATLSVGRGKNWHLCASCAELPRFKRMTARTPLNRSTR
jgi:hypothetical protein